MTLTLQLEDRTPDYTAKSLTRSEFSRQLLRWCDATRQNGRCGLSGDGRLLYTDSMQKEDCFRWDEHYCRVGETKSSLHWQAEYILTVDGRMHQLVTCRYASCFREPA